MEWTTRPGQGPGAEILGPDLRGKRLLELGCGPGHNAAHLATLPQGLGFARAGDTPIGAHVTGVDLVGLQVRRARSHYGRLDNLTFVAGHALHHLRASDEPFDAIYSVFGAIGLVAPELLLPAIAQR
ncbi:class I SAM-dependent methyltransferase, partial [Streptomyces sp. SID11233]|nr:class I SAM-dependent methyltransferase [Streptomyces sp. SID11233]